MKTQIFNNAIKNREKIRFLYGMEEIILDPYFVALDKSGQKVIYGKPDFSNQVRKYEYKRIANIKILNRLRFSPIIPIISYIN